MTVRPSTVNVTVPARPAGVTCAEAVTCCRAVAEVGDRVSVVVVGDAGGVMVRVTGSDALAAWTAGLAGMNRATTGWSPGGRLPMARALTTARPETTGAAPISVAPTKNLTSPAAPAGATVAVPRTASPAAAVVRDRVSAVVVAVAGADTVSSCIAEVLGRYWAALVGTKDAVTA